MIIATAIGTLLNGKTANVINEGTQVANHPISYHYGDQKELLKWLVLNSSTARYPLVWYVLKDYTEFNGTYKVNDAKLVLMQNTKPNPLNTWRQSNSYTGIINPTWEVVKTSLLSNSYVNIQSDTLADKFRIKDEPNYGLTSGANADFQSKDKSISTDIVDARIIRFNLEIEAECIINNN
jgi:hypothetical protein